MPEIAAKHTDDQLDLPATTLARDVTNLITESLEPHLRNHSIRGYFFGRALAESQGLEPDTDYDTETLYLICALHDIGLSDIACGTQRFEVDGADYAARWLESRGVADPIIDAVWDAIAAHTSRFSDSPVYRRRRAPEIWIAVAGIGTDVAGGPADLPPGYADRVHAAYPRLGGTPALTRAIEEQALAHPEKAPPTTLAGELVRQRHPDLPYTTWDMIVATRGWSD
ncbi:HD domain-containing protein [Nocardia bovistercoris]|uniref:HD domain-containing protein n=1 Tax=Nocardia bovistercoris TaxID=2785916 RepID=A0A931N285_9NOCA|nr:HD domain-containing protein [Nocardia bovistercoris]MBH0776482.1 HD domain-containing protein [Nocardia bovistercoris]